MTIINWFQQSGDLGYIISHWQTHPQEIKAPHQVTGQIYLIGTADSQGFLLTTTIPGDVGPDCTISPSLNEAQAVYSQKEQAFANFNRRS